MAFLTPFIHLTGRIYLPENPATHALFMIRFGPESHTDLNILSVKKILNVSLIELNKLNPCVIQSSHIPDILTL